MKTRENSLFPISQTTINHFLSLSRRSSHVNSSAPTCWPGNTVASSSVYSFNLSLWHFPSSSDWFSFLNISSSIGGRQYPPTSGERLFYASDVLPFFNMWNGGLVVFMYCEIWSMIFVLWKFINQIFLIWLCFFINILSKYVWNFLKH